MRARGSTILPWLLIGPVLAAVIAMLARQASGLEIFATVGRVGLGVAVLVMVLAFVANWRATRRRPPRC